MSLGSRVGEYLEARRRLREGCVMFPRVIIFFDRVVRQVNEKAMRRGEKLKDINGGI